MSKVISAHAVSVGGYITGSDPGAGRGLGEKQTLVTTGVEDAIAAAREAAGGKDVR